MSDSDTSFKGNDRSEDQNLQNELSNNSLKPCYVSFRATEPVKLSDHHALGES
jgi:hypothetical protein